MKNICVSNLVGVVIVSAFHVSAHAQMRHLMTHSNYSHAESSVANLVKVGARSKKGRAQRQKINRQGSRALKAQENTQQLGPFVPPALVSLAAKRKKCLESARLPKNGCPLIPK